MNTKISYLYRDASNYKLFNEVVIAGQLSLEQLKPFLIDEIFFVPEELGLPRLSFDAHTLDDHDWHEIIRLEPSNKAQDLNLTASTLLSGAKSLKQL